MANALAALKQRAIATAVRVQPPATSNSPGTCIVCDCKILWTSIYRDGVRRCAVCEAWPSEKLIGQLFWNGEPMPMRPEEPEEFDDRPLWMQCDPWDPESRAKFDCEDRESGGYRWFIVRGRR